MGKNVPIEFLGGQTIRKFRNKMILKLHISHIDGMIDYNQTKAALVTHGMGDVEELPESKKQKELFKVQSKVEKRLLKNVPRHSASFRRTGSGSDMTVVSQVYGAKDIQAAKLIQASMRMFKARKHKLKLETMWKDASQKLKQHKVAEEEKSKHQMLEEHTANKLASGPPEPEEEV